MCVCKINLDGSFHLTLPGHELAPLRSQLTDRHSIHTNICMSTVWIHCLSVLSNSGKLRSLTRPFLCLYLLVKQEMKFYSHFSLKILLRPRLILWVTDTYSKELCHWATVTVTSTESEKKWPRDCFMSTYPFQCAKLTKIWILKVYSDEISQLCFLRTAYIITSR